MTPEEFRTAAHEIVDWIADRRIHIEQLPVRPNLEPGDVIASFPASLPESPAAAADVFQDFKVLIAPATTEVQHPMHFGWFPSNASLASILGDFASSGLGSLGISWESSPALTEVEEVVVDWMRQLTGLSDQWKGVIQDTASTACLVAMLAARERATEHSQTTGGLVGFERRLCVYTTNEAHSSVRKAALLAGYGADDIRLVDVDPWTRDMLPHHLEKLIAADVVAGSIPAIVVASVGSTGATAFDPVDRIVEIAGPRKTWVHVDAAMAGAAMVLPEERHRFEGIEGADSISWNPHKWFGTILDCSLLYLRDPDHLVRVMSTNPSFLRSTAGGDATQYRDWGIPLGRRFRALKLLFQLRIDGIENIQRRLRRDLENARWLATQFNALPNWKVVAPVRLQTVCVRHWPVGPDGSRIDDPEQVDRHTREWVRRINISGEAFLSPAQLDGAWIARISVGVEATERHHLEHLIALIRRAAEDRGAAA
ncbi:MAG: aspartate aminotransferase family protein [Acidimicrobiales bacterium]|nr:aspartate aminotransferase family protein [Acidimicrobiales bacterium]